MRLLFLSEEGMLYDRIRLFYLFPVPHPILYPSSAAQIELLQLLVQIASENNLGEGVTVKIKFNIIASLYDYNPNLATYMKVRTITSIPRRSWWVMGRWLVTQDSRTVGAVLVVEGPWISGEGLLGGICLFHLHSSDCCLISWQPEMWQKCLDCINELMDILFANPNIFVGENILEESENLHNADQVKRAFGRLFGSVCCLLWEGLLETEGLKSRTGIWANLFPPLPSLQPLRVRGCILTLVERMDEEFTKIMQNTDPHSQGEPEQAWASVRGKVQGLK